VEEDVSLLEDYYAVEAYNPARLTPWLLRLVLDDRLTVDKHITMDMIQSRIQDEYEVRKGGTHRNGCVLCILSTSTQDQWPCQCHMFLAFAYVVL
jgi:hypothetical protein